MSFSRQCPKCLGAPGSSAPDCPLCDAFMQGLTARLGRALLVTVICVTLAAVVAFSAGFVAGGGRLFVRQTGTWTQHIRSGQPFTVALADVYVRPLDQSEWGTLKPGSTYTVRWREGEGFTAWGYNLGTRGCGSWTYTNADPARGQISIWGHVFRFDEMGNVTDPVLPRLGICGRLGLSEGRLADSVARRARTSAADRFWSMQ